MNTQSRQMKTVYTVIERAPGKSYWTKVGVGFVNHDGSINLRLDAIPVNGSLQVRDYESPRDWEKRAEGDTTQRPHAPRDLSADSLL